MESVWWYAEAEGGGPCFGSGKHPDKVIFEAEVPGEPCGPRRGELSRQRK